ncbi:hypothetical protein [Boudabousia marimammalium]|uniref:Orn/DAP/Arg decarboxylase 2 N-terminal domain-containing protein n=1 Tax=Boudabousia marimammalium TaxID=156892 RepID=A0A1Q5PRK2_9ACTO|nr:hypothetical protein [Boudabousia marimammalium]OKL50176.1 hypothetical protein BM477_01920 [Boudabousia marimammalium]
MPASCNPAAFSCPQPGELAGFWPWSVSRNDEGELTFGNLTASQLRELHGPSLRIIDEDDLQGRATVWNFAWGEEFWDGYGLAGAEVSFPIEQIASRLLLQSLLQSGLLVEISSLAQLDVVKDLQIKSEQVLVVLKETEGEQASALLNRAAEAGLVRYVLDASAALKLLLNEELQLPPEREIILSIPVTASSAKLGFAEENWSVLLPLLSQNNWNLIGLRICYPVPVRQEEKLKESYFQLLDLRGKLIEQGQQITLIQLADGLGVHYLPTVEPVLNPTTWAKSAAEFLHLYTQQQQQEVPQVLVCASQNLFASAGVTLVEVTKVEETSEAAGAALKLMLSGPIPPRKQMETTRCPDYCATLANRVANSPAQLAEVSGGAQLIVPGNVQVGDILALPMTGEAQAAPEINRVSVSVA